MAEGKRRDEWQRWAAWMAMFANANRDPKKRSTPFGPKDFDPFARRKKQKTDQLSPADQVAAFAIAVGAKTVTVSASVAAEPDACIIVPKG